MEEQSKKLSKVETELYANKYLKQQEAARVRAKKNAQQRKEAGIKLISVNVPEDAINNLRIYCVEQMLVKQHYLCT